MTSLFAAEVTKRKPGRKKEAPFRTCEVCKGQYYRPPSYKQWGMQTCSRKCAAVLRDKSVERNCKHCGNVFRPRASWIAKGFGLYCSKACNGAAYGAERRAEVACRWCDARFSVPKHKVGTRKKHFCNRECLNAWLGRFGTKKGVNAFTTEQKLAWMDAACARCGITKGLELDHIIPRFAGGLATRENAQTLCRKCNREKFWLEDLHKYRDDHRLLKRKRSTSRSPHT